MAARQTTSHRAFESRLKTVPGYSIRNIDIVGVDAGPKLQIDHRLAHKSFESVDRLKQVGPGLRVVHLDVAAEAVLPKTGVTAVALDDLGV